MNESTLLSQLRPTTHTSKFAADDLLPLFNAIRDAGYGDELAGILCEYSLRLSGEIKPGANKADLQNQMVRLMGAIGVISSQLSDISRHSSERDLVALLNTLRTEVLPIVVQLENDLGDRLRRARNKESEPGFESGGLALEH
jgi:hypothetical protein